jgi:hypothetical protein
VSIDPRLLNLLLIFRSLPSPTSCRHPARRRPATPAVTRAAPGHSARSAPRSFRCSATCSPKAPRPALRPARPRQAGRPGGQRWEGELRRGADAAGCEAIERKFGVSGDQLRVRAHAPARPRALPHTAPALPARARGCTWPTRGCGQVYLHYQPTFYHLHVHFTALNSSDMVCPAPAPARRPRARCRRARAPGRGRAARWGRRTTFWTWRRTSGYAPATTWTRRSSASSATPSVCPAAAPRPPQAGWRAWCARPRGSPRPLSGRADTGAGQGGREH